MNFLRDISWAHSVALVVALLALSLSVPEGGVEASTGPRVHNNRPGRVPINAIFRQNEPKVQPVQPVQSKKPSGSWGERLAQRNQAAVKEDPPPQPRKNDQQWGRQVDPDQSSRTQATIRNDPPPPPPPPSTDSPKRLPLADGNLADQMQKAKDNLSNTPAPLPKENKNVNREINDMATIAASRGANRKYDPNESISKVINRQKEEKKKEQPAVQFPSLRPVHANPPKLTAVSQGPQGQNAKRGDDSPANPPPTRPPASFAFNDASKSTSKNPDNIRREQERREKDRLEQERLERERQQQQKNQQRRLPQKPTSGSSSEREKVNKQLEAKMREDQNQFQNMFDQLQRNKRNKRT